MPDCHIPAGCWGVARKASLLAGVQIWPPGRVFSVGLPTGFSKGLGALGPALEPSRLQNVLPVSDPHGPWDSLERFVTRSVVSVSP